MKRFLLPIALLCCTLSPAAANVDYFIYFDPIKIEGDAQDSAFDGKKATELIAFQFQGQNSTNIASSASGGAGQVTFDQVSIILPAGSRAAVDLMREMAKGTHFNEAVIQGRRSGGDGASIELFTLTLKVVVISGVALEGTRGDEPLLEVILDWGAMKFTSPGAIGSNGEPSGNVPEALWSRINNEFSDATE
ncbi:MAG: type VI secretion system tube protein Hcp [Luteolibacter sp.]